MKYFEAGITVKIAVTVSALFILSCNGGTKNNEMENENGHGQMEQMGEKGNEGMMSEGADMQSELPPMMKSYIEIKDGLAADDPKAAKNAAERMMEHRRMNEAMKGSVEGIAGSEDLKVQREHFSELSQEMYNMAKDGEMGTTMFWNHCPMAMKNKGANWLSQHKEIRNPYMGKSMPKCGSVMETLGAAE